MKKKQVGEMFLQSKSTADSCCDKKYRVLSGEKNFTKKTS